MSAPSAMVSCRHPKREFAAAKVVIILQLCKSSAKKNAIYAELA